jgi:hypothetical protein
MDSQCRVDSVGVASVEGSRSLHALIRSFFRKIFAFRPLLFYNIFYGTFIRMLTALFPVNRVGSD